MFEIAEVVFDVAHIESTQTVKRALIEDLLLKEMKTMRVIL